MTGSRASADQRGAGTLLTLSFALVLATALAAAVLWSAVSLTTHRLNAAADLTALSAAATLNGDQVTTGPRERDACATAHRIAATHATTLIACTTTATTVTVQLQATLNLGALGNRTLATTARAGPADLDYDREPEENDVGLVSEPAHGATGYGPVLAELGLGRGTGLRRSWRWGSPSSGHGEAIRSYSRPPSSKRSGATRDRRCRRAAPGATGARP